MASPITVRARAGDQPVGVERSVEAALALFTRVDRACTRFDSTSPLMRANAHPDRWHQVPRECFGAIARAQAAYQRTGGRFDPRVLADLVRLGYSRSLPFGAGVVRLPAAPSRSRAGWGPWRPGFRGATSEIRLGSAPVDLGGIGKGLAVSWASRALRPAAPHHLVEAGGDCHCSGRAPDGGPWRVGVEDPGGGADPLAVLQLVDRACATSSVRLGCWTAGGRPVHHLVDPRTGRPGGHGLRSVTVVGPDAAEAEVWSKVVFLAGRAGAESLASRRGLAALWVGDDGRVATSAAMDRYVAWRAC
ncbi:MAG TPA: FAD:protein FMN transferase [Verrucomicrobiae bacterium]|nr:FAD:protein FMN transferase [Verrucomicrobiae bacterium]